MMFFIYRRHKKYGLGPRIISIFYINGINLHTIGNILCIVAIVIAFIGLFSPWYHISYNVTGEIAGSLQTEGVVELIKLDGTNGLQVIRPGTTGPTPMTTLEIPFSLFIAIGFIFLIIATIGIIIITYKPLNIRAKIRLFFLEIFGFCFISFIFLITILVKLI